MHWSLGIGGLRCAKQGMPYLSRGKPIALKEPKSRGACGQTICRSLSVVSKPVRLITSQVMTDPKISGRWKVMTLENCVAI